MVRSQDDETDIGSIKIVAQILKKLQGERGTLAISSGWAGDPAHTPIQIRERSFAFFIRGGVRCALPNQPGTAARNMAVVPI